MNMTCVSGTYFHMHNLGLEGSEEDRTCCCYIRYNSGCGSVLSLVRMHSDEKVLDHTVQTLEDMQMGANVDRKSYV
jgi:hypothetical protein